MTLDTETPIPSTALRKVPYLTAQGQVVCPVCGSGDVARKKWETGDPMARWQCANGHWFKVPAGLRTRWIMVTF